VSWIHTISDAAADGDLARLYDRARDPAGGLDAIMSVHSLHPAGLQAHLGLYQAVMQGTPGLPLVERELIAWVVSSVNGCEY